MFVCIKVIIEQLMCVAIISNVLAGSVNCIGSVAGIVVMAVRAENHTNIVPVAYAHVLPYLYVLFGKCLQEVLWVLCVVHTGWCGME